MSVLDDMFTKMASLQGHVRVHDCRGMHKSQWAPELGYWVCATCMVALDEKRRGQWATHTWIQRDEVRPVQEESLERGATSRGDADPGGARVREGGAMSDVLGEDRAGDDAGVRGAEGSGQPLKLNRLAMGTWSVESKEDPRWNKDGRGLVEVFSVHADARDWIEKKQQELGPEPDDLTYGYVKD